VDETPYIGFGFDTLSTQPTANKGQKIDCPHCEKKHILRPAKDGEGKEDDSLLFFKCGTSLYLGAVGKKLVIKLKPDISGKI